MNKKDDVKAEENSDGQIHWFGKLIGYGSALFLIVYFVFETGLGNLLIGKIFESTKPPLVVEFRESAQFWKSPKEYVMQVSNMDAQKGHEFEIWRDGEERKPCRQYVKPAESGKEFGELQIGRNFVSGDKGRIKVVGYGLVLRYDLSTVGANGQFTVGVERDK